MVSFTGEADAGGVEVFDLILSFAETVFCLFLFVSVGVFKWLWGCFRYLFSPIKEEKRKAFGGVCWL